MSRTAVLVLLATAALGCGTSRLALPAASSKQPDAGTSDASQRESEPTDAALRDAAGHDAGSPLDATPMREAAAPADDASTSPADANFDAEAPELPAGWPAPTTQPPPPPTGTLPAPQPTAAGLLEACGFEPASEAPLGASSICPGGVYRGDVNGTEALKAIAGCTRIEGSVDINGGPPETFANFALVRVITGDLRLGSHPISCGGKGAASTGCWPGGGFQPSLTPLRSLRCVGGDVAIGEAAEGAIPADLAAFGSLIEVGGALTIASSEVHTRPPFRSLRRVWGTLEVTETSLFPVLDTAYGRLTTRTIGTKMSTRAPKSSLPSLRYLGCGGDDPPCRDGVLGCELIATTNTALEAFKGCNLVIGDVKLDGPDVSDVSSLAALRTVKGSLWLTVTHVPDLNALSGVDRVKELRLDTNLYLNDVSGLDGVALQSIKVQENVALRDLAGWRSIRPIGDIDVFVDANLALETVGDWPWLSSANLFHISGEALTSPGRFDNLVRAKKFELMGPKLATAGTFPGLQTVDEIVIRHTPVLPVLSGLKGSQSTVEITSSTTPDMRGLERLTNVSWLTIVDNSALTSLTGLSGLVWLSRFSLERNPMLLSLHGMSSVMKSTELYIRMNPKLTDCEVEWLADRTMRPPNWAFEENAGPGPCAPP